MKTVTVSESEKLQKEGWTVTNIYLKDGVKVHDLVKDEAPVKEEPKKKEK